VGAASRQFFLGGHDLHYYYMHGPAVDDVLAVGSGL
jgi:hypothetical protein